MASQAAEPGKPRPDARRRHDLIGLGIAAIGLADLEQGRIGHATIAIALHGGEQARQQARPHAGHFARNRIGQLQGVLTAAEQRRLRARRRTTR